MSSAPFQSITRPPRIVELADARRDSAREVGEFVSTSAGTLHAVVRGTGPDVILLHGVTDNVHTWHQVQTALDGNARTHALDLPGHGLSDIPGGSLTARQMAGWVAAYLDRMGISRATILGWSLGGSVAVAFAAENPSRVSALVLEAPAVLEFPFPFALWPLKVGGVAEFMYRLAARPGARRFFMSSTFAPGFSPDESVVERYWRGWQIKGRSRYIRTLLRDFKSAESLAFISDVRCPTRVVHGDHDQIVPVRIGRELPKRLSKGELRELPNVGHAPHLERPGAVLDAVRDALGAA